MLRERSDEPLSVKVFLSANGSPARSVWAGTGRGDLAQLAPAGRLATR